MDSIKKTISAKEKRVKEITRAATALTDYHKLKPIFDQYSSFKWKGRKEKFGKEHATELDQYRKSIWMIKKFVPGADADFDIQALEKEAKQLAKEIEPLKQKLSTRQGELKKLQEIRYFIKDVLPEINTDQPEQKKESRIEIVEAKPKSLMEKLRENQEKIRQEEAAKPKLQRQQKRGIDH